MSVAIFGIFFSWIFIAHASLGAMVDNFKVRHEKLLFESLPFSASGANTILENEYKMNGLSALKTKMAEVEEIYKQKKEATTVQRLNFESAIASLESAISLMERSIDQTKTRILEKQKSIELLEYASAQMKKKIAENRKVILEYLSNIYDEGNVLFDDEGKIDIMKTMIMTRETPDFYLTDMTYKSIVSQL